MEIYKLVYQYFHTYPIALSQIQRIEKTLHPILVCSLTNTKNLSQIQRIEKNLHPILNQRTLTNMHQPISLFHSLFLPYILQLPQHTAYIGYQVTKDESLHYMQLLYVHVQSTTPSKDKLKYLKQNSKSHLSDIYFATIPNQSIYFEHVKNYS